MAKEINTPADFETTRLDGENFDRYIIPADIFIKIIKGEFWGEAEWGQFQDKHPVSNKLSIYIKQAIVTEFIEIDIRNQITESIILDNIIFVEDFYIANIKAHRDFLIKNCQFKREYHLYKGIFAGGYVISDCEFSESYVVWDGKFNGFYRIYPSVFKKSYVINGGEFNGWYLASGVNFDYYRISENAIFNNFHSIVEGVFNNIYVHSDAKIYGNFILSDSYIADSLEINNKAKYFSLDNVFVANLRISNIGELSIKNTKINELYFVDLLLEKSTNILFSDTSINKLAFNNCVFYDTLNLNKVNFFNKKYTVSNNIKYKKIELIEKLSDSRLSISASNLSKTQFIDCDFSETVQFEFISSKIIDIFLAGTSFPSKITTEDFAQQRLGYGQLKKVYENRGDMVEGRYYYQQEMIALWKQLNANKTKENKWERALLWLNHVSNRFSTDWVQGVKFTGIVALLFFPYMWSTGNYWPDFSMTGFTNVARYFEFLLPTHKLEMFGEGTNNGFSYIIDLIARIAIGYGIYQTIAAFRKHGRSGA